MYTCLSTYIHARIWSCREILRKKSTENHPLNTRGNRSITDVLAPHPLHVLTPFYIESLQVCLKTATFKHAPGRSKDCDLLQDVRVFPRGDNVSFELTYVFIVISVSATSANFGHMLVDSGPIVGSLKRWLASTHLYPYVCITQLYM